MLHHFNLFPNFLIKVMTLKVIKCLVTVQIYLHSDVVI